MVLLCFFAIIINGCIYIYVCNIVVSDGITINATTFIAEREIKLNLIVINHLHCT